MHCSKKYLTLVHRSSKNVCHGMQSPSIDEMLGHRLHVRPRVAAQQI